MEQENENMSWPPPTNEKREWREVACEVVDQTSIE